jgi:hypothetical protein
MHEKERGEKAQKGLQKGRPCWGGGEERVNWPVGWGSLKIYLDSYVPFMQTKDLRTRGTEEHYFKLR